jgi:hypothetical protein
MRISQFASAVCKFSSTAVLFFMSEFILRLEPICVNQDFCIAFHKAAALLRTRGQSLSIVVPESAESGGYRMRLDKWPVGWLTLRRVVRCVQIIVAFSIGVAGFYLLTTHNNIFVCFIGGVIGGTAFIAPFAKHPFFAFLVDERQPSDAVSERQPVGVAETVGAEEDVS